MATGEGLRVGWIGVSPSPRWQLRGADASLRVPQSPRRPPRGGGGAAAARATDALLSPPSWSPELTAAWDGGGMLRALTLSLPCPLTPGVGESSQGPSLKPQAPPGGFLNVGRVAGV